MRSHAYSEVVTACTLDCPDACSLLVSQGTRGISIGGNPRHPFTAGFTCAKIKRFLRRLKSPHRLTTPLLRHGDHWVGISWDEALGLCAEKIGGFRHEPASILHFHGEGAKGVLKQAGKLFFSLLGASRTRGSLCDAAGYVAYLADFGSRDQNDLSDLVNTARIVNWGKDLSRSSVHTAAAVQHARKRGAAVLTISPGGDGNAAFSDDRVRVAPGSDRFLAAAVLRLMMDRGLFMENPGRAAHGLEAFLGLLGRLEPDALLKPCGLSQADAEKVAQYYVGDGPTATLVGAGVQRHLYGGENVRFINALALMSGNMGRKGGGSYFHLHSLRNVNLDWIKIPDGLRRRSLSMPVIGREILAAKDPPVRMIWVNGSNVINQAPGSQEVIQAFEHLEFKVVVDAFMTDTADRADLVLPSALMLEQEDITASYLHNFVQYARPVFAPPGEARSDFDIFAELAARLDPPLPFPDAETCMRSALEAPFLNDSLETLREQGFIRASRPQVAYSGLRFDHPDGKCRLPADLHPEPEPPAQYPLRLLTLVRRDAIHSQILPEDQKMPPTVWVAPDCPALAVLDRSKDIHLASPLGRLKVRLEIMPGLHPGALLYRRGDWLKLGGGVNRLIEARLSDMGNGAPYYVQNVCLENGKEQTSC